MSFVDKPLKCSDCGADFTFTASEQELLRREGLYQRTQALPIVPRHQKSPK